MAQKETSKRRQQEDSRTNAVSFRLRDVTISMERTSQPEGLKFTIVRGADVNCKNPDYVAGLLITSEANGTTLRLGWSDDATVWAMDMLTEVCVHVQLAIARNTSNAAGAER